MKNATDSAPVKRRVGEPLTKPHRWTASRVSHELPIDRDAFVRRAKRMDILPGEDGCWSTAQVFKALHGDLDGERLRLMAEQADKIALENEKTRMNQVSYDCVIRGASRFIAILKARLSASTMSEDEKTQILTELHGMATAEIVKDEG